MALWGGQIGQLNIGRHMWHLGLLPYNILYVIVLSLLLSSAIIIQLD